MRELTPKEKRVVENAAIHADHAVKFRFKNDRGPDDHEFGGQVAILAVLRNLRDRRKISAIEFVQILRKRDIAGVDIAKFILDDAAFPMQ